MRELFFDKGHEQKICLALGFFDCLHIGHIKILERVKKRALQLDAKSAVFTFINNPFEALGKDTKLALTFEEREDKLKTLNIDFALGAEFNAGFRDMCKDEFLDKLFSRFNIASIACGEDYKFGKYPQGNIDYLANYCKKNNIVFDVIPTVLFGENKASSTSVRDALLQGDIYTANKLLRLRYPIKGVVEHGSGRGSSFLMPTANILPQKNKQLPRFGVYKTHTKIIEKNSQNNSEKIINNNNKLIKNNYFLSVTNVGQRPTFDNAVFVETHLIGFEGDLYGKEIVVEFDRRLRDIVAFESKTELVEQIKKDIDNALKGEQE